jgi:hypothetical protein
LITPRIVVGRVTHILRELITQSRRYITTHCYGKSNTQFKRKLNTASRR